MKPALFLLLAFPLMSAYAQTGSDPIVTKVVRVRGNADRIASLVRNVTNSHTDGNNVLGAVIINGKASDVANLEKIVRDLDSGSQENNSDSNVELIAYVVAGLQVGTTTLDPPNEVLTPVIRQLRAAFPYKQYGMLGTFILHSATGSSSKVSGMIRPIRDEDVRGPIPVGIECNSVTVGKNNSIHLQKFAFSANLPFITPRPPKSAPPSSAWATVQYQTAPVGLNADIDLRENQKVVVAQSNIGYDGDSLFLVLSAHVVR